MEIAGVGLLFLVVGAIVLCLYFLPTIIGFLRNKMAICALNFFLGWTLVGWVVSLVWSLTVDEGNP
jgi:hypothetical protein